LRNWCSILKLPLPRSFLVTDQKFWSRFVDSVTRFLLLEPAISKKVPPRFSFSAIHPARIIIEKPAEMFPATMYERRSHLSQKYSPRKNLFSMPPGFDVLDMIFCSTGQTRYRSVRFYTWRDFHNAGQHVEPVSLSGIAFRKCRKIARLVSRVASLNGGSSPTLSSFFQPLAHIRRYSPRGKQADLGAVRGPFGYRKTSLSVLSRQRNCHSSISRFIPAIDSGREYASKSLRVVGSWKEVLDPPNLLIPLSKHLRAACERFFF